MAWYSDIISLLTITLQGVSNKHCLLPFFICSNRIRTVDAMATYSSHRLTMGKEEIDSFICLIGDILKKKLQKCLLSSPLRFI